MRQQLFSGVATTATCVDDMFAKNVVAAADVVATMQQRRHGNCNKKSKKPNKQPKQEEGWGAPGSTPEGRPPYHIYMAAAGVRLERRKWGKEAEATTREQHKHTQQTIKKT